MADELQPGSLIVYGVPFSQPVRAVLWLLVHKRRRFSLELVAPGSSGERGSRHSSYLAINPAGTIPAIREPETGFVLAESNAILAYLCNAHGWTDLYPEAPHPRASVDWYLHFHHRAIRSASSMVASRVRPDLKISESALEKARQTFSQGLNALEGGWLTESAYLTGDSLSIADFAAYAEIGQLQPKFTNFFDFSPYPNIERWMRTMKQVDGHDDVHVVLSELGDICATAPTMDQLKSANKNALRALKAKLETF